MKPRPDLRENADWDSNPLEWARASGRIDELMEALAVKKRHRLRRRLVGTGAALAILSVIVFHAIPTQVSLPGPAVGTSHALVTEPERRILPDGSLVELKPGSELLVKFVAGESGIRSVELTRGAAHFQVVKDADRPFVVTAATAMFRAVGTAFSVTFEAAAVEMLVTEGRVAVEMDATAMNESRSVTIVEAGSLVTVPQSAGALNIVSVSPEEERRELAWRVPRLEFHETSLNTVVAMLTKYSGHRIVLADDSLSKVEISGALRGDGVEPLLQLLETTHGIVADRQPDGSITLSPRR